MKIMLRPSIMSRGKKANPGIGMDLWSLMEEYKPIMMTMQAAESCVGMNIPFS
jgi:hypothetical protein